MTSMLDLIILALAVYRLTRLVTTDVILDGVREKVWRRHPPERGGVGYLITCDWCTSLWLSSLVVVMYTIAPELTILISSIFAISGFVGIANRAT